jgi:hypothetical protein
LVPAGLPALSPSQHQRITLGSQAPPTRKNESKQGAADLFHALSRGGGRHPVAFPSHGAVPPYFRADPRRCQLRLGPTRPPDRTHLEKDGHVPSLPLDGRMPSQRKKKERSETDGTAAPSGRPKNALLHDCRWRSGGPAPRPRGTTRQGFRSLLSNSPGARVGPPPGSQHPTSRRRSPLGF